MNKNNKQTTMRFTEQDLEAIARIRDLYGCISDTAAVRLALQLVARQETPALSTRRKEDLFPPHGFSHGSPQVADYGEYGNPGDSLDIVLEASKV